MNFSLYYWPFLNWFRVIQRCQRIPVGCCWPGNRRWGYLMETAKEGVNVSATGRPPDKQFWTSLWIKRAQSYWALLGSSRCLSRTNTLLLPHHFQSLPPAPFMPSFPISSQGGTDAPKCHVTLRSLHPCTADQCCKPSQSATQTNKWLFWNCSWRISIPCQELLKSSLTSLLTLRMQLLWH